MAGAEQAILCASWGIPVFPCRENDKKPAINSYPELATTDANTIRGWWGNQNFNIGLAMGNGLGAFDMDIGKNPEAVADFEAIGGDLSATRVHRSVSGGLHAIYRVPEGEEYVNSVGFLPGLDYRGSGGYIVGPYSFVIDPDKGLYGEYEVVNDIPPAPLPDALKRYLKPIKPRKERLNGHSDAEKAIPLYIEYLKHTATPAIEGQGGDQTTYNVACMGVIDYGLTVHTTYMLMLEYYNERCSPPWEAGELLHKVENAEAYGIGEIGSKDPDTIMEGFAYVAPTVEAGDIGYDETALDAKAIPNHEFLVYPLILPGKPTAGSGPGGLGKSALGLVIAAYGAVGRDLGPLKIAKPFSTAVFNIEDDKGQMSGRLQATCKLHGLDFSIVRKRVFLYDADAPRIVIARKDEKTGKIGIPQETFMILDNVFRKHPDIGLMIFDPYIRFHNIRENDAEMGAVADCANAITRRYGSAGLIFHHIPKGAMNSKNYSADSADMARGSGATTAGLRLVANILPQTETEQDLQSARDDLVSIRVVKSNYGPTTRPVWFERKLVRIDNGGLYPTFAFRESHDLVEAGIRSWVDAIGDHMVMAGVVSMSVNQATTAVMAVLGDQAINHARSVGNRVRDVIFRRGAQAQEYCDITSGQMYDMELLTQNLETGKDLKTHIITLVPRAYASTPVNVKLPEFKQ